MVNLYVALMSNPTHYKNDALMKITKIISIQTE